MMFREFSKREPDYLDATWQQYGSVTFWDECLSKARRDKREPEVIAVYEACLAEAVKRELHVV